MYHNGKVYEVNKEFRDKVNFMVRKRGKTKYVLKWLMRKLKSIDDSHYFVLFDR